MGDPFTKYHIGIRIWNVNANKILMHENFAELHTVYLSIIEYDINVISFQEVNLDLLQPHIRDQLHQVFLAYFPYFKITFSTTPIKDPTAWKPWNTIIVSVGKLSQATTHTSSDSLG